MSRVVSYQFSYKLFLFFILDNCAWLVEQSKNPSHRVSESTEVKEDFIIDIERSGEEGMNSGRQSMGYIRIYCSAGLHSSQGAVYDLTSRCAQFRTVSSEFVRDEQCRESEECVFHCCPAARWTRKEFTANIIKQVHS